MYDIQAALMAETTPIVQIWMMWMTAIFLFSIFFAWRYKAALYAFYALIGTVLLAYYIWTKSQNVHLFGIAHIILWTPLALYVWHNALSPFTRLDVGARRGVYGRLYGIWAFLLFLTIVTSLIFDVRDLYWVFTGQK